jgi:hypothetical protein
MHAPDPNDLPPDDAVLTGTSRDETTAELLALTWDFFHQASPAVVSDLRQFLTTRRYHPTTCLGWYLDSLQFTATSPTPVESESRGDEARR